jgi:hypothetical protein
VMMPLVRQWFLMSRYGGPEGGGVSGNGS